MEQKKIDRKMKALTFSFDDAVTQDIRFIELLSKYNMKATFNLNSDLLGHGQGQMDCREGVWFKCEINKAEDVKYIYDGHEVAAHGLTHPNLSEIKEDEEVIRQIEQDRIQLSQLCGYEVVGMAYPGGTGCYDDRTIALLRDHTGIQYARTTTDTHDFKLQSNLYEWNPSVFHRDWDVMFELGERFIHLNADSPQIFSVWGHTYELDIGDDWGKLEEFLQMMSHREDISYCTNREAHFSLFAEE